MQTMGIDGSAQDVKHVAEGIRNFNNITILRSFQILFILFLHQIESQIHFFFGNMCHGLLSNRKHKGMVKGLYMLNGLGQCQFVFHASN